MAPQNDVKHLDCKRVFKLTSTKVGLVLSILDKIKIDFSLDPQKLAVLNAWTSYALARVFSECDLYKHTNDEASRKRYEDELDKMDAWIEDLTEVLGKYGALKDATNGPAAAPDDAAKKKAKSEIEATNDKHAGKAPKDVLPTIDHKKSPKALFDELTSLPALN